MMRVLITIRNRLKTDIWDQYAFAVKIKLFVSKFQTSGDEMNE